MCAKTRKAVRYEVVGRVESDELSAFPGTILDLSINGCKIHYSNPVTVSLDTEYVINIKITGGDSVAESMTLICQPVWACEDSGSTDIGVKFLHSPDTDLLNKFIFAIEQQSKDNDNIKNQIVENECQFI
jgi:hypothetical protein